MRIYETTQGCWQENVKLRQYANVHPLRTEVDHSVEGTHLTLNGRVSWHCGLNTVGQKLSINISESSCCVCCSYRQWKKAPISIGAKTKRRRRVLYLASPQLGPISTSHTLGTSKGTADTIISAIYFACSLSFTDIAISSWIWVKGTKPSL